MGRPPVTACHSQQVSDQLRTDSNWNSLKLKISSNWHIHYIHYMLLYLFNTFNLYTFIYFDLLSFRWVTFLMGKAAAEWSLFTKPPVSWYQGAVLGIRCIDPLQVFRGVHVLLFLRLFLFSRGMPMQSRFCSPTHKFKSCAWKIYENLHGM